MLLLRSEPIIFAAETSLLILAIYTLPYYTLDYICNMSNNLIINTMSNILKNLFFIIPIIPIIYLIIGQKINHLLGYYLPIFSNGSHIYINIIVSSVYLILSIMCHTNFYLGILFNSIAYSIYLSETIYHFLDPDLYKYNNLLDFYNFNKKKLLGTGLIFSVLTPYIPSQVMPFYYFIFTIFAAPLLIANKLNSFNALKPRTNVFYIFEIPINFLITIGHAFLYNNITIKNIKKN